MNIELSEAAATAEGTSLPPPRRFGETNTITVAPAARRRRERSVVARVIQAASGAEPMQVRVAIVPADASPLTITL